MKLSKNFTTEELACQHCKKCLIKQELVDKLQLLRDKFGKAIRITSGYRCEEHNKAVGGASESQHVQGLAVDIDTSKFLPSEKYLLLSLALNVGFTGIGIAKSFLHIDVRASQPAVWTY